MDTAINKKQRPKYLNLLKIRLPVTGMVSILHRVSGVLLLISIPVFLYLLQASLQGPGGFDQVADLLRQPLIAVLCFVMLWALAHHFFAGIRFLLFDLDIGVAKASARRAAWLVVAAEALTLLLLLGVWL